MLFLLSGCFNDFISLPASHILISLLVFIAKVKRVRHNFFSHSGVQMPDISSEKCCIYRDQSSALGFSFWHANMRKSYSREC